ncbi:hypothetical protein DM02DRAFT_633532 [Periconia macrospinosa]|uniref:DNA recombination and repair protein Rad51-like C-terminal domain-containing protein n=1 Tax=Periconia macrospinosa TaxID=97972 RepID=A0A2V1D942_9PLEO|nr:hypothetical protein DM02DRAFT_633532 [Periconia macrospinosa]
MASSSTTTTTISNPPTIRRAEPLIASNLVGDAEVESLFDGVVGLNERKEKKEDGKLGTGIASVDKALRGGIESGGVVGIGFEVAGGVGGEFCLTLLANSLLLNPTTSAAVIDTTGNFNILRLYTQIVHRLQSDPTLLAVFPARTDDGDGNATVEDLAAKVLERVNIMRVFDLVGVMEAVGEIREGLEGVKTRTTAVPPVEHERDKDKAPDEVTEKLDPVVPPPRPRKTVIADSEDEDEDMLFEEEENSPVENEFVDMNSSTPATSAQPTETEPAQSSDAPHRQDTQTNEGKISFILIDNLAHVINPLLKKDYIHTRAQSSTFLLTLSNLSKQYNLHTILVNPCHPFRPSSHRPNAHQQHQQQQQQPPGRPPTTTTTTSTQPQPTPPSIFPSTNLIPSLLPDLLPQYLDLHLLISHVPRGRNDAKVVYADDGFTMSSLGFGSVGGVRGRRGGKGTTPLVVGGGVLEVLADRWEGRMGGWGSWEL